MIGGAFTDDTRRRVFTRWRLYLPALAGLIAAVSVGCIQTPPTYAEIRRACQQRYNQTGEDVDTCVSDGQHDADVQEQRRRRQQDALKHATDSFGQQP